jgi:predicted metal-dependent phosphoesterase TrpH
MPVDLHIHTKFSDGMLSPRDVVLGAKKAGLTAIAITDHDTVEGIDAAIEEGKKIGIQVVPGIELTTDYKKEEVHILGYFIDHKDSDFLALLTLIRDDRVKRIYKTTEKLKALGVNIDPDEVIALADDKGSVGRPHIARMLIKKGFVRTMQEAFSRYLDHTGPAYVPHFKLDPFEAVEAIKKAKGIPVLAHPGISPNDGIIDELVPKGLKGIEVYYWRHSAAQVGHYLAIAKKHGLLVTGGSDFHGSIMRDVQIGDATLPDEEFKKLEVYKINEA